jgi:hypothetical protein
MLPLTDYAKLSHERRLDLETGLARLSSLGDVVAWALGHGCDISAVVVQDEFTHDVVVPWRFGLAVVFDTT